MKKYISVLLAVVMLITSVFSFSLVTFAMQTDDIPRTRIGSSKVYYEFDSESKTLILTGEGAMPDFANDSVSQPWYSWRSDGSIDNIYVEDGITSLGNYAFYCVNAENVSLPNSLREIGSYAFSVNSDLVNIRIPNGVGIIHNNAFYQCLFLESVYIPSTVTTIESSAFEKCTRLNDVTFERMNMTVTISRRAFLGCSSLSSIDIPKNATLSSYSVGFKTASSGSVDTNMTMRVYRDSAAYNYAVKYFVNYTFLDTIDIENGETISRTYYEDNINDEMKFSFIVKSTCNYEIVSSGDIDVDCVLTDSQGNVIAECSDISSNDLNFLIDVPLVINESYCFIVTSIGCEGDFSVSVNVKHTFVQRTYPPSAYLDGYVLSTCVNCGYGYMSDFVSSYSVRCCGCVYEMADSSGACDTDRPVVNAKICDADGNVRGYTDEDGYFDVKAYRGLAVTSPYAVGRTFAIGDEACNLGNIAIVTCDYNPDGYINAKDFAVLRKAYGECDQSNALSLLLDRDGNGIINYDDWSYAMNFTAYGKIDETLYDN